MTFRSRAYIDSISRARLGLQSHRWEQRPALFNTSLRVKTDRKMVPCVQLMYDLFETACRLFVAIHMRDTSGDTHALVTPGSVTSGMTSRHVTSAERPNNDSAVFHVCVPKMKRPQY